MTKNPKCTLNDCDKVMIVHIEADSDSDRLHYIYDFSGKPAVLIAKADKNSSLEIDWEDFIQQSKASSIRINPLPSYTFASVIDSFVVFNDSKDVSNFSDASITDFIKINPHNLSWSLVSLDGSSEQNATLEMNAEYPDGGNFTIKVRLFSLCFLSIINYNILL